MSSIKIGLYGCIILTFKKNNLGRIKIPL